MALAGILLFNLCFTRVFFDVGMRDGHLFGSLIDVLKNGATIMLLATGMTLVIATGGIDLSVGAVMAISGGAAAVLILRPEYSFLSAINAHGNVWIIIGIFWACRCSQVYGTDFSLRGRTFSRLSRR